LTSIIDKINSQKREFYPSLILDADVLSSSETNIRNIQKYKGTKIITPHAGEFRNMFSDIFELHAQDKIECAKLAAKKIDGIVVLKGPHTVIAHPDGRVYVNLKSTQALARAGTGDVLAGFITGLVAQGFDPFLACCMGVVIHSNTALKLEKRWGVFVVNAFLLSKNLNKVFSEFSSKI
jgi:NAD(P)H-hydrate epimerase